MRTIESLLVEPRFTVLSYGDDGMSAMVGDMAVIASWGGGWDHVSVSKPHCCPSWEEMNHVKNLFFRSDEVAIQYHPAKADYKNVHPHCLHLWRPQDEDVPAPPRGMV